ncbi:MAG: DedA family protein [archaeon]|jgi:membrane protein DedA with SNARE-associated domain
MFVPIPLIDITGIVSQINYLTIFLLMIVDPLEMILIPAGVLVAKHQLNMFLVIASAMAGAMIGAIIGYFVARFLGREFLVKNGILLIQESHLEAVEKFYKKHGAIATLLGRLIPFVRQYIALPAGLVKMNFWKFLWYIFLGSIVWILGLTYLGYFLGDSIGKGILTMFNVIFITTIGSILIVFLVWYFMSKTKHEGL